MATPPAHVGGQEGIFDEKHLPLLWSKDRGLYLPLPEVARPSSLRATQQGQLPRVRRRIDHQPEVCRSLVSGMVLLCGRAGLLDPASEWIRNVFVGDSPYGWVWGAHRTSSFRGEQICRES